MSKMSEKQMIEAAKIWRQQEAKKVENIVKDLAWKNIPIISWLAKQAIKE